MNYDPHTGAQIRFERTDRSGRWSPIYETPSAPEPFWLAVLGVCVFAAIIATMFAVAI